MTTVISVSVPTMSEQPLTELAEAANAAHSAYQTAMRSALGHARDCGRTLLQVKAKLPYGEFNSWIKENCRFSLGHAYRYMRLATSWTRLVDSYRTIELTKDEDFARAQTLDGWSMRRALSILFDAQDEPASPNSIFEGGPCSSCGAEMIRTSIRYHTCPDCWNCPLHENKVIPKKPGKLPFDAAVAAYCAMPLQDRRHFLKVMSAYDV